jgi:hypothetical protein
MDKTAIAFEALPDTAADAPADRAWPKATDEPRPLAGWELAMVGGGETSPDW